MERPHYNKGELISVLWQQEASKLLQLPTVPLEIYRLKNARLNKYSELQFDETRFPLPQCKALLSVLFKVRWDEIDVLSADGEYQLLATFPRPYTEKAIPLDWRAIFEGYQRRPRSVMYSSFTSMMPKSVQIFVCVDDAESRKTRIALIRRLLKTYALEQIGHGLVKISPMDERNAAILEHVLYAMAHPEYHPEPFTETHTPECLHGQFPQLEVYDRLMGGATS